MPGLTDEQIDKSGWMLPEKLSKIGDKPPLHSQNRQELCEALPYFRSYQGGHYVSNRRTMGYLLDGCPAPRDVFEDSGRVIISHGGGGSTRTQPAGSGVPQLTLVKSQTRDNFRVKALQACQQRQFPVVLIAGKKYSGMPWIQKYGSVGYAVLGYYLVTHSWPEKEFMSEQPHNYCIRFKFRFQWMSSQGDPWWLSDMEESLESCINGAIPPASMPQSPWLPEHDQQEDSCPGENVLGGWSTNDFQPGMDVESDSNTIVHEMASCTLMDSWEDGHPQGDNDVEMDCQATGLLDSSEEGHPEGDHGVEMDCETTVYSDTPDYEEMGKVEDEEPIQYTCNACGMDSLLIYQGCWMCLNEECEEFFQRHIAPSSAFHDGSTWTEGLDELRYVPWFLKHQQFLEKEERVPYQLKPRLTLQELDGHQRENFAAHLPRQTGFYCSSCGRLSVRIYWGALICSNAECQFRVDLSTSSAPGPRDLPSSYGRITRTTFDQQSFYPTCHFEIHHYSVACYAFLDQAGLILHATPKSARLKSAADTLFKSFQTTLDPLSLKRNRFKHNNRLDGVVAQTFTLNCGEPYKYCTEVETKSWEGIPTPAFCAYSVLCRFLWHLEDEALMLPYFAALPLHQKFNEVLSCLYLPGSGMNYHSDNECGLGGIIGSLSLGSTGLMRFKRKPTKMGAGFGARQPPHQQQEQLKRSRREAPVLRLLVGHGDIVFQCGSEIQDRYVHSIATDGLRISATARYIAPTII